MKIKISILIICSLCFSFVQGAEKNYAVFLSKMWRLEYFLILGAWQMHANKVDPLIGDIKKMINEGNFSLQNKIQRIQDYKKNSFLTLGAYAQWFDKNNNGYNNLYSDLLLAKKRQEEARRLQRIQVFQTKMHFIEKRKKFCDILFRFTSPRSPN